MAPKRRSTAFFSTLLGDLEADVYLDQVDALAKEFGGAATVRSAPTARNVAKTIVTIYIPQYSSKLNPGTHPLAARMLTTPLSGNE
jgi:hypothetical protein